VFVYEKCLICLHSPIKERLRKFIHALSTHTTIAGLADWPEIINGHVTALAFGNDVSTVEAAVRNLNLPATDTIGLCNIGTNILVPDEGLDVLGNLLSSQVKRFTWTIGFSSCCRS